MPLPWLRELSIHARLTLITTVVALLVLIPLGIGADVGIRRAVSGHLWDDARQIAFKVAADVREGTLHNPIRTRDTSDLVQVVTPSRQVVAASPSARDLPVLTPRRPGPDDRFTRFTACPLPEGNCAYAVALRTGTQPDAPVVIAARQQPMIITTRLLELIVAGTVALLSAVIAWLAWKVAGRALHPVEAIRAQLAAISGSDLSARVLQPPGHDEIARLARTVNDALSRLERSVNQQRQFAADASHELRTPITGICAQLESALPHPEDHPEAMKAALRDTKRLEAIMSDLLFLARIGTADHSVRERVDLGALATTEVNRRRHGPIAIDLRVTPGVTVTGVDSHLSRVLVNLLNNAERHAKSLITVEVGRDGDEAVLAVGNDGDPIPEEDRERIFQRFTRLDTARSRGRGGTGLGLAIAREVIEAHHGRIRVGNTDSGALFVARLPITHGSSASSDE
ncbi:ATP-binding protein [Microtetraspora sp. NBRC 16547]|uniref:ATP-binding protein n=1 Tax=Microtetraspora sp. NBRC 16547 TaxID=3030993 RepID=UPI0024A1579A|nr:ATP-binding protein [Microtetraspora sp. NBRC 16547]GLX01144.1 two-component sensor histidine kinase [Microtetraspora sp. NBRC 16547]